MSVASDYQFLVRSGGGIFRMKLLWIGRPKSIDALTDGF